MATGPLMMRVFMAAETSEPVDAGDMAGPDAMAQAVQARAVMGLRDCLFCGCPAGAAMIIRPAAGRAGAPYWADLCRPCFAALLAETAAS
jgi:hypothetical protein